MSFSVHFDIQIYFFVLFAGLAVGAAYFMYHNASYLTKLQRSFLAFLRALSVFLLLLAVSNLVTDFIHFTSKKRDVFVLVDDSKSMSLTDGSVNRAKLAREVLRSAKNLSSDFDVVPITFGSRVEKMNNMKSLDSLKFDQPATDIESALDEVAKIVQESSDLSAFVLLLTDGNYNTGSNPIDVARTLPIPVYAIGIGDSTNPKDIVVHQLITSPTIYAGKKSVVNAIVSSSGFGGKIVAVQLIDDGKVTDSKYVKLPDEGDVEVSFDYVPDKPGTHVLKVSVSPQKGEASDKNNSSLAIVDVLKGKHSVLLVAGEPAVDVAFIKRNIEASGDFDLETLVQRDANTFYVPMEETKHGSETSQESVTKVLSKKYDAIVLYDFPNFQSSSTFREILDVLNSSQLPFVYFAGNNFSSSEVTRLPRLPFSVESFRQGSSRNPEIQIGLSMLNSESIPAWLQPVYSLLNANVNLMPPLYFQRIESKPTNGSIPLAFPVFNSVPMNSPVFYVSQNGKSAAFLAYGLWRTQLMSSLSGLNSSFLKDLLTSLLRMLINSGKQKLLTVHADKKVYDPSELVNLNALLVDQSGAAVDGAVIDVRIRKLAPDGRSLAESDVQLSGNGNGSYSGTVNGLSEGKYFYFAEAKSGQNFLGADSGTILVEPLNREFVRTSMNVDLLRQISTVTGGEFLESAQFIRDGLPVKPEWKEPVRVSNVTRFEILSSLPILVIVFVSLSVEWIMRKIWGLP
jgi:hypothetical protein